jgi:hypothetical protein
MQTTTRISSLIEDIKAITGLEINAQNNSGEGWVLTFEGNEWGIPRSTADFEQVLELLVNILDNSGLHSNPTICAEVTRSQLHQR